MLADNRDEYLERPTSDAGWRRAGGTSAATSDDDEVLCGLDMPEHGVGGTWFGINRSGAFGILTNFTEIPPRKPPAHLRDFQSRGNLVLSWLRAGARSTNAAAVETALHAELERVKSQKTKYAAFNLLLGCAGSHEIPMGYITNGQEDAWDGLILPGSSERSSHGLSNSTLSTPWRKVVLGEDLLAEALQKCRTTPGATQDDVVDALFGVLRYA